MSILPYTKISNDEQYYRYCSRHEELAGSPKITKAISDELDLLEILIDAYDREHSMFSESKTNPVELIKLIMQDHRLKAIDLARILDVSPGLVSDMLNYKKALSKNTIRILAKRFALSQETLSEPYPLRGKKAAVKPRPSAKKNKSRKSARSLTT